jgi:hypothetical protein
MRSAIVQSQVDVLGRAREAGPQLHRITLAAFEATRVNIFASIKQRAEEGDFGLGETGRAGYSPVCGNVSNLAGDAPFLGIGGE